MHESRDVRLLFDYLGRWFAPSMPGFRVDPNHHRIFLQDKRDHGMNDHDSSIMKLFDAFVLTQNLSECKPGQA